MSPALMKVNKDLVEAIQQNCDVSDARDHGIYSMCSMVLKLRNLYKWEHGIEPWSEPEPADLLDWIDTRETFWKSIEARDYASIPLGDEHIAPWEVTEINKWLAGSSLFYGAGLGRSTKGIFFLAEIVDQRIVDCCPVIFLGRELAKEMASPFAMVQDGTVIIRREALRYFLWDHIQELRSSSRSSLRYLLDYYGLLDNGELDQNGFRERLDTIVERESDLFVYHEIGELLQTTFNSETLQKVVARYPGSVVEFVCRALKDVLSDTHPRGVLARIIDQQKDSSLALYVGFLDGLRERLFPEMKEAWERFLITADWSIIEQARSASREKSLETARRVKSIAAGIGDDPDSAIISSFQNEVLSPLGLEIPEERRRQHDSAD